MRKFHFLKAVVLLSACLLAFSCERTDVKPIVDYRCQVTAQSESEGVYCNTPIPIQMEVKKNDADVGNYTFSYTVVEGDGDLFIDEAPLKAREEMSIDLEHFTPKFIAKKLGEHRLMFQFKNEKYKTEALYVVTADNLVFEAAAVNLPKKMLIDKPFAFDIQLIQKMRSRMRRSLMPSYNFSKAKVMLHLSVPKTLPAGKDSKDRAILSSLSSQRQAMPQKKRMTIR